MQTQPFITKAEKLLFLMSVSFSMNWGGPGETRFCEPALHLFEERKEITMGANCKLKTILRRQSVLPFTWIIKLSVFERKPTKSVTTDFTLENHFLIPWNYSVFSLLLTLIIWLFVIQCFILFIKRYSTIREKTSRNREIILEVIIWWFTSPTIKLKLSSPMYWIIMVVVAPTNSFSS